MKRVLANIVILGMIGCFPSSAQVAAQPKARVLMIEGQSGQAAVRDIEGRSYVDIEGLAQITGGSLRYQSNAIVLSLPGPHGNSSSQAPVVERPAAPADDSELSRDFMRAAIEEIASMREWASTLAYAIQNNYQVTDSWAANYREQAAHSLGLATTAATTGGDRNAAQLLRSEFEAVRDWSNRLVKEKQSMDTAKYALAPNALRDDPQSQKIINCGRFLAQMLGSGKFADDPSCH